MSAAGRSAPFRVAAAALAESLLLCVLPRIADAVEEAAAAYNRSSCSGSGSASREAGGVAQRYNEACATLLVFSRAPLALPSSTALVEAGQRLPAGTLPAAFTKFGRAGRCARSLPFVPQPDLSITHANMIPALFAMAFETLAALAAAIYNPLRALEAGAIGSRGSSSGSAGSSQQLGQLQAEAVEAGWELLGLVPTAAAAIQQLEGAATSGSTGAGAAARGCSPELSALCTSFGSCLSLLQYIGNQRWTAAQVGDWATAAEAGLRLLPALARMEAACEQGQQSGTPAGAEALDGPRELTWALVAKLWTGCAISTRTWAARVMDSEEPARQGM